VDDFVKVLVPFPTAYECEAVVSALIAIRTKFWNIGRDSWYESFALQNRTQDRTGGSQTGAPTSLKCTYHTQQMYA